MKQKKIDETLLNQLACPHCQGILSLKKETLICSSCEREFKITDGIPDFRRSDEYWCNVSRDKMRELNKKAAASGDWLAAARKLIPEYVDAFEPFDRADAQFLWPTTGRSRILDAGSGWGGLTLPVAQYCGEIFAVDKTVETLNLLKIRAKQMGYKNVNVAAANIRELPFPDSFFDMVIVNGVLEWVAFDQDIVLESHWDKKRADTITKYSKNPREVQVEVLKELHRVLKPGGHLYLAIENSIGYQYLAGIPDDHVNIKYVSFLPRFLANVITKRVRNTEYRTYVYTLPGYRKLLKDGNFIDAKFYGAFPHYIHPSEAIPEGLIKNWKNTVLPVRNKAWPIRMAVKIFPSCLLKYVSPSFMILARKDIKDKPLEARIVQSLRKAGLLSDSSPSDIQIMKSAGRAGSYHPANFLVFDINNMKPAYFCKVCRDKRYSDILKNEAENLKAINQILEKTDIKDNVPHLLYFGTKDGITLLVTQYMEGKTSGFNTSARPSSSNIYKLDDSIKMSTGFLVRFQKYTQKRKVDAAKHLLSVIKKQEELLKTAGKLTGKVEAQIKKLLEDIKALEGLPLLICAVHGDFDFYHNILFKDLGINVVDFEHYEPEGLPFLDLATLIFNPILISLHNQKKKVSIKSYIKRYNLERYIKKWLKQYSELSGISVDILKHTVQIAALEQQTKQYPYYRNPDTLPMYPEKVFSELLSIKIE